MDIIQSAFRSSEKWILGLLDTASLNTTKKGQERSDQNRSWRDRAGLAYDAPLEAEDTDIARAVPPATELSPEPL